MESIGVGVEMQSLVSLHVQYHWDLLKESSQVVHRGSKCPREIPAPRVGSHVPLCLSPSRPSLSEIVGHIIWARHASYHHHNSQTCLHFFIPHTLILTATCCPPTQIFQNHQKPSSLQMRKDFFRENHLPHNQRSVSRFWNLKKNRFLILPKSSKNTHFLFLPRKRELIETPFRAFGEDWNRHERL